MSRNQRLLERVGISVVVSGVVLTALAALLYGLAGFLGGSAGALIAFANWSAIRWLAERVTSRSVRSKGRLAILATFKTSALMASCWIAVTVAGLDSRAFIIGISALVAGILLGPLTLSEGHDTTDTGEQSHG